MSLIVIKEIGYGLKGDKLDMTIAIPKDSYLDSFCVCSQRDLKEGCESISALGIDYIKAVQNTEEGITRQEAFYKMFTKLCEYTDVATDNTYDIYQIKSDFIWITEKDNGIGIKVSKEDLNFITMELDPVCSGEFTYSTECGEDSTILTVPLCDMLQLKLKALDAIVGVDTACKLPRNFIDKLLQLRTIELAICCKDYYTALVYWDKFYGAAPVKTHKRCGCHGGGI